MKYLLLWLLVIPQLALAQPRFGHEPYGPPSPLDVCVSSVTGQIAVVDAAKNQVALLDADWKPLRTFGPESKIDKPVSVARTLADELAVLITGGTEGPRVVVLSSDGLVARQISAPAQNPFNDPRGVAVDDSGNVFVFDTGNKRVAVFDKNGGYLFDFGAYVWTREFEGKRETLQDRLDSPVRGDFLPDGRLIIADYYGAVINPKTNQRGGRFSVWQVDVKNRTAAFVDWAWPSLPYETATVSDVAVDRKTGDVFYSEGDFPLTDYNQIKRQPKIGAEPESYITNMLDAVLTGTTGLAIGANGEVIVAEGDKGKAFAMPRKIFDKDVDENWPRHQRLVNSTQTTVTLQYDTAESVPTTLHIAPAPEAGYVKHSWEPAGAEEVTGEAYNSEGYPVQDPSGAWGRGTRHRIVFTGLKPGKQYAYRRLLTERAYPSPFYSETCLATTQPPTGKTQYNKTRMIVLLFTNVCQPAEGVPAPGPMTTEEIQGVKDRMEVGRTFYWVNSRCHLDLDFDYVLVDKEYDKFPVAHWGYFPEDEHKAIDQMLEEKGVKHEDTSSLFTIYGYRVWDAATKKWTLAGSGGNTWGSCHDGSAMTAINSGGDTSWLLIHEHGHGIGIDNGFSGNVWHFNHFHWNRFPERYGAHYDGNVAIARAFNDVEYWADLYGKLVVVDDADGDGIPDSDPGCPMDEKRFGSDSAKIDTDGDGLRDLEELMAYDGVGRFPGMDLNPVAPYFDPNPKNKDTDGDRIPDGQDRYPLYAFDPSVYRLPISLDGKVTASEYSKGFVRPLEDSDLKGDVRMAYTDGYLVFAFRQKAMDYKLPPSLYIELDANDDGMTVGADNQEFNIAPKADGTCDISDNYNDTIIRMKPTWKRNDYPSPQDCFAKWTKVEDEYQMEFAVPRTSELSLRLNKWNQFAALIYIMPDGKPQRRLFQLQQQIEFTCK